MIQMETNKKDKIMHGIIFILVVMLCMSIMIVVDRSFSKNKKEMDSLKTRIEKLENWTDEVEKNGIGIK